MKVNMKYWQSSIAVVMVGMALLVSTPVFAESINPGVSPLNSPPSGVTFGKLNASWWQWFFSVPASKNPGLAADGAVDCSVGQSGNVWFLAGQFQGRGSDTHSCTIPAGKTLVIPLINSWVDNICNKPPLSVPRLRAIAANFVTPVTSLFASIDGQPLTDLQSHRAISPVFNYMLPSSNDNVISAVFEVPIPGPCWPSLTVAPAVADGFYIIVPPLPTGLHSIKFGGSGGSTTVNMTYNLTVLAA
jgi:hypothetical protein